MSHGCRAERLPAVRREHHHAAVAAAEPDRLPDHGGAEEVRLEVVAPDQPGAWKQWWIMMKTRISSGQMIY